MIYFLLSVNPQLVSQMLQMFTVAQFGCGTGVAADIRTSKSFSSSSPAERGEALVAMTQRLERIVDNIVAVASATPHVPGAVLNQ